MHIFSAVYDAADHQVTLTLHTKIQHRQSIQLQIKGTPDGAIKTQEIAISER